MALDPKHVDIFHITLVGNLQAIVTSGGLMSDSALAAATPTAPPATPRIGYSHIKARRMTEIRVPCCANRFVGEFVPFYYCPRSPMLYTVNRGSTGLPAGCQRDIIHLVTTVDVALGLGRNWAIADGNAGAFHTAFYGDVAHLDELDWKAIRADQWSGVTHQKSAEFLVADFFPWDAIEMVGCYNHEIVDVVSAIIATAAHQPKVAVRPDWYY